MLCRVISIILILFFVKCNCKAPPLGYFTVTGLQRGENADGVGNKTDFKTWWKILKMIRGESGSGEDDDDDDDENSGSADIPSFPSANCKEMQDITFLLDASESIGPLAFRVIKFYTKQILNKLDLSHCDNVGIIKFGESVLTEMFLGTPDTKTDIFARIDALEEPVKHVEGEVNKSKIAFALEAANGLLFTSQLGLRQKSEKYLVLMTDGKQPMHDSSERSVTIKNVLKKLTNKGIRVLVLAMGEKPATEELARFTTEERYIFPERRFEDLMNILVPKDRHPNVLNGVMADFYVADETAKDGENSFNFGN